jgi:hypothetical protein
MNDTTSNDHFDDRWTSPCCFAEMGDVGEGLHDCPECRQPVLCSLKTIPSCAATTDAREIAEWLEENEG